VLLLAALAAGAWLASTRLREGSPALRASVAAAAPAQSDASGFARAMGPRPLSFPTDLGPHDDFQTEWWYYTGNLDTSEGQHFGYQLTFFRRALVPPEAWPARASDWGTAQVYMAHLALTDVSGNRHYAYERLARGAAGLAGAAAEPYRVWLDEWSVVTGSDGLLRLQASDGAIALQLDLRSTKPRVLQGEAGYSRKGPEPGNASYYFSETRIATKGTVTVDGRSYAVDGLSWMDHEFSTSALSAGQTGWDWFSLQLSSGRELMVFQLRRSDGNADPFSAGMLVNADGTTERLGPQDFALQVTGQWRSPHTRANYPSGWRLTLPAHGVDLTVTPYIADQELNVGYNYWEGAVRAAGTLGGQTITGSGYVELTGYAGSMSGQF
jgi:predicted secreted hydrolase